MSQPCTPIKDPKRGTLPQPNAFMPPPTPLKPKGGFILANVNLRNNDNYFPGVPNQAMPSFDFNFSSVNDQGLSSCAISLKSGMLRNVNFDDMKGLDQMSIDMDENLIRNDIIKNHEIKLLGKKGFFRMGVEMVPKDIEVCSVALSEKRHWKDMTKKKKKKLDKQKKRFKEKITRDQMFGIVRKMLVNKETSKLKRLKTSETQSVNGITLNFGVPGNNRSLLSTNNSVETIKEEGYSIVWETLGKNEEKVKGFKEEIQKAIQDILVRFEERSSHELSVENGRLLKPQFEIRNKFSKENNLNLNLKKFRTPKKQKNQLSPAESEEAPAYSKKTYLKSSSKTNKKSMVSNLPTMDSASFCNNTYQSNSLVNGSTSNPTANNQSGDFPLYSSTTTNNKSLWNQSDYVDPLFPDNLQIIKVNSKLDSIASFNFFPQYEEMMNQMVGIVESNPMKPYTVRQVIFYFQMEHYLRKCKLKYLSDATKFRIICFCMSSFLNLKMAFGKFDSTGDEVDLKKILKKKASIKRLIDIYELTQDEQEMEKFFFIREADLKNLEQRKELCRYLKMLIVVMVCLLDLMKVFLNFKTGDPVYKETKRLKFYKKIVRNGLGNSEKIPLNSSLMGLSISQLLSEIDLRDLQIYISINKTVVKKHKYHDISFRRRDNHEIENIIISYDEHFRLFCPKYKRKDELTKFLFKYIKKQMFNEYRVQAVRGGEKIPYKMIVSNYDTEFLPDTTSRKIYYSENINKKNLVIFMNANPGMAKMICEYVTQKMVKDLVTKLYNEEESPVFGNTLSLKEFANVFVHASKKHILLFKDCVIALETLNEVFKFC